MIDSSALGEVIRRVIEKAGLRRKEYRKGNRYTIPTNHGLRHRFDEIMKSVTGVNPHIAEKMFAHTSRPIALDTVYNNPPIERMFVEYKKIIPYIMIDDSERNKIELRKKENINKELQKKFNEIEDLKQQRINDKKDIQKMILETLRNQGIIMD